METRKRTGLVILAAVILIVLVTATVGATEPEKTGIDVTVSVTPTMLNANVEVAIGRLHNGKWFHDITWPDPPVYQATFTVPSAGRYWVRTTDLVTHACDWQWVDVPPEGITVYVDLR